MPLKILLFTFLTMASIGLADDEGCEGLLTIKTLSELNNLPENVTMWTGYRCESCGSLTSAVPKGSSTENKQDCPGCGSTHGKEPYFTPEDWIAAGQPVIVATEKNINQAKSGKVLECPNCGTTVFKTSPNCPSCGEAFAEIKSEEQRLQQLSRSQLQNEIEKNTGIPKNKQIYRAWAAAAVLTVASLFGVGYYGVQTYEVAGTVTEAKYTISTIVDRYSETKASDWRDNVTPEKPVMPVRGHGESPGATNIRNQRMEIHHYETRVVGQHPVTKTRTVPHTTYHTETVSNGNGSFTTHSVPSTSYTTETYTEMEPTYQNFPIEKVKVDYDTFVWNELMRKTVSDFLNRSSHIEGLPWPVLPLGPLDRARHEGKYTATIKYQRGKKTYMKEVSPATELEFLNYVPDARLAVVKNNFGWIVKIKDIEPPQ